METAQAEVPFSEGLAERLLLDHFIRLASATLEASNQDSVAICDAPWPEVSLPPPTETRVFTQKETVLRLALNSLPIPGNDAAWQDILDFKSEGHDKQWGLRRFLQTLATKAQTEAEIKDDLEWMLNEYTTAMKLHHLKASQSFVDVFVITPLEIIENLVKFNWSRIARGALQVQKRKIELMEAEMKAPGRECAYIFDAQKRFGPC